MANAIKDQSLNLNTHENRKQYQDRVQAELDKLDARVDGYRAKLEYAEADTRAQYHDIIEQLTTQRDAIAQRFEELQKAGDKAWIDLQTGFEQAWTNVNTAFQQAAQQFEKL